MQWPNSASTNMSTMRDDINTIGDQLNLNNNKRNAREDRLWKIMTSNPDEPLYGQSDTNKRNETYTETSSVIGDNENIPPSHIVINNEGYYSQIFSFSKYSNHVYV